MRFKDGIRKAVYGVFSAIWASYFYHYWNLLGYYFTHFDYWNDMKVMYLTFVLETWQLVSLIMFTWCMFKLVER